MDRSRLRMPVSCAVLLLAGLACNGSRIAASDTSAQQGSWLEGPESYLFGWYDGGQAGY
jgi:hypothetical protein